MTDKARWFWGCFLGCIALDQLTKILVVSTIAFRSGEVKIVPHLLSIVHAQNPGAAFGMLTGYEHRQALFALFAAFAAIVIGVFYRWLPDDVGPWGAALGLFAGGMVGNQIDRFHKGTVTDFVRFYTDHPPLVKWLRLHVGMSEWPAFNVADSALLVGVAVFIVHAMFFGQDDDLLTE